MLKLKFHQPFFLSFFIYFFFLSFFCFPSFKVASFILKFYFHQPFFLPFLSFFLSLFFTKTTNSGVWGNSKQIKIKRSFPRAFVIAFAFARYDGLVHFVSVEVKKETTTDARK